jgi:hypothetical protein
MRGMTPAKGPLTAPELVAAGRARFGDAELFSLYGVPAAGMQARWLHVLGRMAAECVVDRLCLRAAASVDALTADHRGPRRVVDLFAGSANVAFHLSRAAGVVCHASEIDRRVYRATRHNLRLLDAPVYLHNADYRDLLGMLPPCGPADVYVLDPSDRSGRGPAPGDVLRDIRRSRDGVPFILLTTGDRAAAGLDGAVPAGSFSLPAVGGHSRLTVSRCAADRTRRLAG